LGYDALQGPPRRAVACEGELAVGDEEVLGEVVEQPRGWCGGVGAAVLSGDLFPLTDVDTFPADDGEEVAAKLLGAAEGAGRAEYGESLERMATLHVLVPFAGSVVGPICR
jgi:hypothetical protein